MKILAFFCKHLNVSCPKVLTNCNRMNTCIVVCAVYEEKATLSPKDEMPKLMCIITGQSDGLSVCQLFLSWFCTQYM